MKGILRLKSNDVFRKSISFINWIAIISILISLASIFIVTIYSLIHNVWRIELSPEGVKGFIYFWSDYSLLIKFLFASMTLFVANYNLMKFLDSETVKSLSDLREKMRSEDINLIHSYLLAENDKEPIIQELSAYFNCNNNSKSKQKSPEEINAALFDYLGIIELGIIMLDKGLISKEEFKNQFGYRYENIRNNSAIMSHINNSKNYYKAFLKMEHTIKDIMNS